MIDFTFTPEIEAVRLKVRAFMDEQVRPQWDAIDQNDRAQVVKAIVELRKLAREDWLLYRSLQHQRRLISLESLFNRS